MPAEIINEYFEDKNFYRYYLIRRGQDEMDKKDDKPIKIEVSTYNWGPCVVKVKILDDFKKGIVRRS